VAVGDYVELDLNKDGTGVITRIDKRKNYISRKAPRIRGAGFRGERLEQIVAANIDKLFVVGSVYEPDFNNKAIDRFIVIGESSHLNIIIIINKTDLQAKNEAEEWTSLYRQAGYKVISSSIFTGEGLLEIKEELSGNKSILWGHSGVGKSSLLNSIFPGLNLKTGKISSFKDRGTHKTVTVSMIKVAKDTFIIDTPGVREIDPFGIKKEDLGHYFVEFEPFISGCRFNTCTHYHEPECKVIEAVVNGNISELRYASYLRILETIEKDIIY
jgi:ribosome biogenesis GTPase / thiamine phosphate phosphatase